MYESYKDSGINELGQIPIHWELRRMDSLFYYVKESIAKDSLNGKSVFHISIPSVQEFGDGQLEDGNTIDSNKFIIKGKEILYSKLNPRKETLFLTKENDKVLQVCSTEFLVLIPKKINFKFSYYLLKSYQFKERVCSTVQSATRSHQRASPEGILKMWQAIPPIEEQESIVAYLDRKCQSVEDIISKKQNLISLLQEERTAIVNHTVTKGIDPKAKMKPSGIEWVGEMPSNWKLQRLSTLGRFSKGRGIKKDEVKDVGYPCIRYGEIYTTYDRVVYHPKSFVDEETAKQSVPITYGDILFAGSGETEEDIGKAVAYLGNQTAYAGGDIIILRLNKSIDPEYLSFLINANFVQHQKALSAKGEIIIHIYAKDLRNILLPFPTKNEQKQILDYLSRKLHNLSQSIIKIKTEINLLQEYKQSLINEVVTGKLCVFPKDKMSKSNMLVSS